MVESDGRLAARGVVELAMLVIDFDVTQRPVPRRSFTLSGSREKKDVLALWKRYTWSFVVVCGALASRKREFREPKSEERSFRPAPRTSGRAFGGRAEYVEAHAA